MLSLAVLESGTGSGSLTHALARAVSPTGHVHTFDFHEQRATEAAVEFERYEMSAHKIILDLMMHCWSGLW